ncbi:ferredoxin--nitrite reductase [Edaphobacter acidisoli]|uniref:Ferredoxin--nitrite reductase n=1 Tax=Edaphobacter acidisoli TaxID=2040573 RepID=A0A916W2N9_9BACT|nr:NirA family protein [Edaphobacter acidisoli]GGA61356.1 ferredoxin--nitrite reductase [Edaphobacter acidisoli]
MVAETLANTTFGTEQFTAEQKEYLRDFFAKVAESRPLPFVGHTAAGLITNDRSSGLANQAEPAEETYFGAPVSDLCREERWKFEQNPLDLWDKLLEHANENKVPAVEDVFRFKFHGLFYVAPAQDSFMLRMRVPGGVIKSHQLRGLAELASLYGAGRAEMTTRSNFQLREFQPKDIVRVLNKVQSLGMSSRGSGADNVRNITASPLAGIDPCELYDVAPLAEALNAYIYNSRDMYGLPRKFNVAFDGGGNISVVADTNDIGFLAVEVGEGQDVPAGIYFRVLLCGITGHKQFASDCGVLLRPDQTVAVAAAMIRVFAENGDRTDRKKARLKYLVDTWGVERFLAETEKRLAFPLIHLAAESCKPRKPINRQGHIGVHPQSQKGMNYIGVVVPVGRVTAEQMVTLARVAEHFGTGELRLTVWQNALVPNVADANVDAAVEAIRAAGLNIEVGGVLGGTVACTGNKGCKYAASDTKSHAVELANFLDERFRILQPVNLHVTGCSHSCAQHYIGDIGLMGVKVNGEEGYQVNIGGGSDQDQGIGRELIPAIRFADLPAAMEGLFAAYTEQRGAEESFLEFSRRHSIEELKSFCMAQEVR